MTTTADLATFVESVSFDNLSAEAITAVEKRVLDSLGIAVAAMDEDAVEAVRRTVRDADSAGPAGASSLWGEGVRTGAPGAAMYNTALTRYLDYMDSFLAPGETPHPSDNIGAVVACAEQAGASGRELIAAIATAYEVQGELAWNAPVRDRGFDHVTHTVISATCGAGHALGLDHEELRNAIGIGATAHNALRVTRTGGINEWKGLASANAARNAVYAVLLANNGVEGPRDVFEGQKGWQQVIAGEFSLDLDPDCPRLFDTMTKRYVAETYAQSAVEAMIALGETEAIEPAEVESIHLETFAGAKLIIGGGEGSRYEVETRAQADHSLPYMLAAALCDGELTVDSYDPERIRREDVQSLLRTVEVSEDERLTEQFEDGLMPAVIDVELTDGTAHHVERDAFRGHPTEPMTWDDIEAKFRSVTDDAYGEARQTAVIDTVRALDDHSTEQLVAMLD